MADDQAFIGYRSAGRRRPELNDRRASADVPVALARGAVSGVLGAPGDLESLVRMLPGLSEQTVLPTSEDVERRLPLRSASETPVGRAATGLSQLAGGFYTGPGSPLRALGALPSSVRRAGADFAMAAGQPAVNVLKPKGGNWLAGSVEKAIDPMRPRGPTHRDEALMIGGDFARQADTPEGIQQMASNEAVGNWLNSKLAKYIRNEMATPEDPLRALAERGVSHIPAEDLERAGSWIPENLGPRRKAAGFPEEGMATGDIARGWELIADEAIHNMPAGKRLSPDTGWGSDYALRIEQENPWLTKVPPETMTYGAYPVEVRQELGFGHLVDELKNAINPASGLPENLRWKYSDLDKVTVPQAVERVAKINEWRAAQKAEADLARAMGPATHVFKEYPEQGFKWVELRQPKETGRKVSVEKHEMDLPPDFNEQMGREVAEDMAFDEGLEEGTRAFNEFVQARMADFGRKTNVEMDESIKALEDALKYEGETMGHCVGGYCPDVAEGRSKIFSLRDKKGQPHVTIEVQPGEKRPFDLSRDYERLTPDEKAAFDAYKGPLKYNYPAEAKLLDEKRLQELYDTSGVDEIVQIKGKANRAPNPEYLPAVQDFVRSGKWSNVGDLKNTGLIDLDQAGVPNQMRGGQRFVTQDEYEAMVRKNAEGFSLGGLVQKYAEGGLVMNQANIYGSDAKQDPASAYKFADGGQAGSPPAYAEGGLVANSPTVEFDPARIDAIVGELHAMNAG